MEPLNLDLAPPRAPRERLAGIVFTARLVDKLRASLPRGELNGYMPMTGFSALWAYYTEINLTELRSVVMASLTEQDVEAWIQERTVGIDRERINGKMERFDSNRIPDEDRVRFNELYPVELRERHPILFDLFEADDARLYA
jgi:hypothetical protein